MHMQFGYCFRAQPPLSVSTVVHCANRRHRRRNPFQRFHYRESGRTLHALQKLPRRTTHNPQPKTHNPQPAAPAS
jgi:hypothetical protein